MTPGAYYIISKLFDQPVSKGVYFSFTWRMFDMQAAL